MIYCNCIPSVIFLPAHPASFAHKFLFQRVPASPGMQKYGRLVIKNSVLDSLVCIGDSLILETASPRTDKPKIVNESLTFKEADLPEIFLVYKELYGSLHSQRGL